MTRSELIKKLSSNFSSWPLDKINIAVDTVFDQLSSGLSSDNRIELRGFGSFSIRKRKSRMARNPKNNQVLKLDERNVIYFRAGKELREFINK
jgi:integration host factor subunit beta